MIPRNYLLFQFFVRAFYINSELKTKVEIDFDNNTLNIIGTIPSRIIGHNYH